MHEPNDDTGVPHPLETWIRAGISARWFVGIVGGILLLVGIVALAAPVNAERGVHSVRCGTGFQGQTSEAEMYDAGVSIADTLYGDFTGPEKTLEELCGDAIGTRRAWGWPVGAVGAVALLGAAVVRNPGRAA